jgi:transposase InsO family protein
MSLRKELVMLARQEGANKRELFRRYGIQPRIGYNWLKRYAAEGDAGLLDQSRRPQSSPERTPPAIETKVLELRRANPCWGGRKLRRRLIDLGEESVPSASTVTAILHRHGLIDPSESAKHRPFTRFERELPNEIWQMDYKGHFALRTGRCHPLTVLDDHSRFALSIAACPDERWLTVQAVLTDVFRRYGLPDRMLTDNGAPWGDAADQGWTVLGAWLIRIGVGITHGRPYHPQTQGKDERFHRSLKAEVISQRSSWRDLAECHHAFETWRHIYNTQRPHEALGLATPVSRYRSSPRVFPEDLPPIEYAVGVIVRKVSKTGEISFANRTWQIGKAFARQPVALQPTNQDGQFDVFFGHQKVGQIDRHAALI